MDYRLKNGEILTDEEIEKESEEYEKSTWKGTLEDVKVGRPTISGEALITISVSIPKSMLDMIDERSGDRSDFIRRAIAKSL
jgi:hypothetical protein